jgi:hypothetical protein
MTPFVIRAYPNRKNRAKLTYPRVYCVDLLPYWGIYILFWEHLSLFLHCDGPFSQLRTLAYWQRPRLFPAMPTYMHPIILSLLHRCSFVRSLIVTGIDRLPLLLLQLLLSTTTTATTTTTITPIIRLPHWALQRCLRPSRPTPFGAFCPELLKGPRIALPSEFLATFLLPKNVKVRHSRKLWTLHPLHLPSSLPFGS